MSCGTPLAGSYCHACGELDVREREHSIAAFLRDHLRALTDVRGKGARSFGALVRRPGLLTREYMDGRTVRWLHPLQLFLLANLLFFLLLSATDVRGVATPLRMQLEQQFYSELARDALRDRFLEMDSVAFPAFEARFNLASEVQAKSFIILLVPLFAALLFVTRAWKREPGVQHIVFATHFLAWALLLFMLIGLLLRATAWLPAAWQPYVATDEVATWTAILGAAVYLYLALRRAYSDGVIGAAARAALLGISYMALLVLYRMILFFTVLYSI